MRDAAHDRISEAFQNASVTVLRCKTHGTARPSDAADDRAGLKSAVVALKNLISGAITLSGVSFGGRQTSVLAANEPDLVDAPMLFSYPLHPPGKPTELRSAHFSDLRTRSLFVPGTKDPFGSIAEVENALRAITAAHALVVLEGAGHDLKRGRFDFDPVIRADLCLR